MYSLFAGPYLQSFLDISLVVVCCRQMTLPYSLQWQQAFSWSQNWNLWFKFHPTYGIPIDFKILLDVFWNSLKCYDRERGMAWNLYETVNINFPFVSWRCHWVLMFTALLRQAVESRDQHPFKTLSGKRKIHIISESFPWWTTTHSLRGTRSIWN